MLATLTLPMFVSSGLDQSSVSYRCCSSRTALQGQLHYFSSCSISAFSYQIWRCFPGATLTVFSGGSWCSPWSHSSQRPRPHWPHCWGESSTQPYPEGKILPLINKNCFCSPLRVRPLCLGFSVWPFVLQSDSLDSLSLLSRKVEGPRLARLYPLYFSVPTELSCGPAGTAGPEPDWCWISDLSWPVVPGAAELCLRTCFISLSWQSNHLLHTSDPPQYQQIPVFVVWLNNGVIK